MLDVRCSCGAKIAEVKENEVFIMDRKCKQITVIKFKEGKMVITSCEKLAQDREKLCEILGEPNPVTLSAFRVEGNQPEWMKIE